MSEHEGAYTLLLRPLEQSLMGGSFTLRCFEAVAFREGDQSPVCVRFWDWCGFVGQLAAVNPVTPVRSLEAMRTLLAHGHSIKLSPQLGFNRPFSANDLETLGFPASVLRAA